MSADTPGGRAAERVFQETGDWDAAAQAALDATVSEILSASGTTLEQVADAVIVEIDRRGSDTG
jgi:hypothetical protein